MIGATTVIIKKQNKYSIYQTGAFFNDALQPYLDKNHIDWNGLVDTTIDGYEVLIQDASKAEVDQIAKATHCNNDDHDSENYHRLAGDSVLLFDCDTKLVSYRSYDKDFVNWKWVNINLVFRQKPQVKQLSMKENQTAVQLLREIVEDFEQDVDTGTVRTELINKARTLFGFDLLDICEEDDIDNDVEEDYDDDYINEDND